MQTDNHQKCVITPAINSLIFLNRHPTKQRLMKSILAGFFFLYSTSIQAQTIQNVNAVFSDGMVTITYDLVDSNFKRKYKVGLAGSHNNFERALARVTGDVGDNIIPGTGKKTGNWRTKAVSPSQKVSKIQYLGANSR